MNDLAEGNGERFRGSLGPKVTGQAGRVLLEEYLQKATRDLKVALSQRADLLAKTRADANLVDGPMDAWDDNDARVEFAMSEIATCPVLSLAVLKIKLHCYEELRAAYGQEDRRVIQMALTLVSQAAGFLCSKSVTAELPHRAALGHSEEHTTTFWRAFARPEALLGWGGRRSHD
jgi:hypothetical protein